MQKCKVGLGAGDRILNQPFAEPAKYWSYHRKHMIFTQIEGRRPAGYIVAMPNAQRVDDPGQFIELELVNQIRPRVKAWPEQVKFADAFRNFLTINGMCGARKLYRLLCF